MFRLTGVWRCRFLLEDDFCRNLLDACLFVTDGSLNGIAPEFLNLSDDFTPDCNAMLTGVNNPNLHRSRHRICSAEFCGRTWSRRSFLFYFGSSLFLLTCPLYTYWENRHLHDSCVFCESNRFKHQSPILKKADLERTGQLSKKHRNCLMSLEHSELM